MQEGEKMAGGTSGQRPGAARGRGLHGARGDRDQAAEPATGARRQPRTATGRQRWTATQPRPERYLVAVAPPTDAHALAAQLGKDAAIRVLRKVGRGSSASGYPHIAVIETTPERAASLATLPTLHVDLDHPLTSGLAPSFEFGDPSVAPIGELQRVVVEVHDDTGRPVEDAAVCLLGAAFPATGVTNREGRAELAVPAGAVADAGALLVRPRRGCWPARVNRPRLTLAEPATVVCERITTTYPEFPERALDSWGARAMGFDRLPPTHRGHGVRIALIDSGVAVEHPDLTGRIATGRDVVGQDDKTWQEDLIGTGTHHAVLIAGHDDGTGMVGLAPETEVHVCRTAPGGRCADLIESLDYCIDQQVDVALIATGITEPSRLLAEKIEEARQRGVACVAASGDAAGPIAYPAALPGALAVGAIGRLGTFPAGSGHAAQISGLPTPDGLFAARFANTGPGLDCCAPGVAIVSGLPPATYGPLDGTATAAAHVAAVAGLVLAHHPQFRPEPGRPPIVRGADRVDRLFQVILASCRPLPRLGPFSSGAGLPDAAIAVGVAPWGTHTLLGAPFTGSFGGSVERPGQGGDQASPALRPLRDAMRSAGLLTDDAYPED